MAHALSFPRMEIFVMAATQDVADGVSSLLVGCLPLSEQRLVLVGGHCSIQGFDATGEER